jgi:hypothetical protein
MVSLLSMVTMGYPPTLSVIINLLVFAITSRQLAHAVTTADIEIQPTSTIQPATLLPQAVNLYQQSPSQQPTIQTSLAMLPYSNILRTMHHSSPQHGPYPWKSSLRIPQLTPGFLCHGQQVRSIANPSLKPNTLGYLRGLLRRPISTF